MPAEGNPLEPSDPGDPSSPASAPPWSAGQASGATLNLARLGVESKVDFPEAGIGVLPVAGLPGLWFRWFGRLHPQTIQVADPEGRRRGSWQESRRRRRCRLGSRGCSQQRGRSGPHAFGTSSRSPGACRTASAQSSGVSDIGGRTRGSSLLPDGLKADFRRHAFRRHVTQGQPVRLDGGKATAVVRIFAGTRSRTAPFCGTVARQSFSVRWRSGMNSRTLPFWRTASRQSAGVLCVAGTALIASSSRFTASRQKAQSAIGALAWESM